MASSLKVLFIYSDKVLMLRRGLLIFFCIQMGGMGIGQAAEKRPINLVLIADAFQEERALSGYELKPLIDRRPGTWRYVRVHDEEEIQKALSSIGKNEAIQTLVVSGLHAGWEDGKLRASVRYGKGSKLIYQFIDFARAFRNQEDRGDRFSPNALVIFESCHLVPSQNTSEFFVKLASVLGLRKGRIYANHSYGIAHPSNLLLVPFYEGDQGPLVKSLRTLSQAVWPFTLAFVYAGYKLLNRGYLADIQPGRVAYVSATYSEVTDGSPVDFRHAIIQRHAVQTGPLECGN
jgi:hypothetical protein